MRVRRGWLPVFLLLIALAAGAALLGRHYWRSEGSFARAGWMERTEATSWGRAATCSSGPMMR